jgi:hypothetical protein
LCDDLSVLLSLLLVVVLFFHDGGDVAPADAAPLALRFFALANPIVDRPVRNCGHY